MVAGLAGDASQVLAVDVSGVPPFTLPPHAPEATAVWSGVWREAAWIACARDERANACGSARSRGRCRTHLEGQQTTAANCASGPEAATLGSRFYRPVSVAIRRLRACSIARHPITSTVPLTAPLASISGAETRGLGGLVGGFVVQLTVYPLTTWPQVNVPGPGPLPWLVPLPWLEPLLWLEPLPWLEPFPWLELLLPGLVPAVPGGLFVVPTCWTFPTPRGGGGGGVTWGGGVWGFRLGLTAGTQ